MSAANVLEEELAYIEAGRSNTTPPRRAADQPKHDAPPEQAPELLSFGTKKERKLATEMELCGLAFSGGGIRSATFNLGVLQALAELGFLARVDYLSTVSGGGYIGSWLTAWIHRLGKPGPDTSAEGKDGGESGGSPVERVQSKLCASLSNVSNGEPAVRFLREHSNYLTPRTGFFGADTWSAISTYLRNLTLNLAILIGILLAALLLPRWLLTVFQTVAAWEPQFLRTIAGWLPPTAGELLKLSTAADWIAFALLLPAVVVAGINLRFLHNAKDKRFVRQSMESGRPSTHASRRFRMSDKIITVYPAYGYKQETDLNTWRIPMRIWVHKKRRLPVSDDLIRLLLDDEGTLRASEVLRCRTCIEDFVADDDSGENVSFKFDCDDETYRFKKSTNLNGLVEQEFKLSDEKAQRLLSAQQSESGWLRLTAEAEDFRGPGKIRLLEPDGLSVVSDIDDTIKVSEIPAGGRIVLRNTFLRDYTIVPEMVDRYRQLGDRSFHYVSGSPWQLFGLLHTFLIEESGFPEGTFHMKSLKKNLVDFPGFFRDVRNFVAGKKYTKAQKIGQITELMRRLPRRKFVLIGDSGELDPEVFAEIRRMFPVQVDKIVIRDVVGAKGSSRLAGVDEVIDAPLITHGKSQFD